MDFSKINLFKALTRKMAWLANRQEVLAQNVAQANTPGYKAMDLKPADFSDILGKTVGSRESTMPPAGAPLPLMVTNPAHFTGNAESTSKVAAEYQVKDPNAPGRLSGNDVVLEKELAKVGQNSMDYELTTNLYRRQIAMFKMALGGGGSGN